MGVTAVDTTMEQRMRTSWYTVCDIAVGVMGLGMAS